MRTLFLAILFGAAFLITNAFINPNVDFNSDTEEGIQFQNNSFEDALLLAKKENKLIFLDIYATWCGPCKRLKAKTFSDAEVGLFYNSKFINLAIDGEKGEGPSLAKKYGVSAYPTLLFINEKGEVVKQARGYHNSSEFLKLGRSVAN